MRQFNKIAIIGVGLIGGSIGLAIKKRHLAREVIGIFRHRPTLRKALKHRAIDKGTMSIKDGVEDAELVILATPVQSIPKLAQEAAKYAKKEAIITDVGSTKRWIVDMVEKALERSPSASFVGAHPMAGSEHAGVEFAKSDLFEGSPCIVTETRNTDKRALKRVKDFWKALGANVEVMSPATHDKNVALISHLPHIVGFSLASAVPKEKMRYAAEGFIDTTRVASSDPKLWADIFLTNRSEILKSAAIFERDYKRLVKILSKDRCSELVRYLKAAKLKRDGALRERTIS